MTFLPVMFIYSNESKFTISLSDPVMLRMRVCEFGAGARRHCDEKNKPKNVKKAEFSS